MKTFSVLVILSTLSLSHSAQLDCKEVKDWSSTITFEGTDKKCADGVKCVRPVWDGTAYKTAADGAVWGCAECTNKKNCVECDTSGCNIIPVFKCKKDASGADSDKPCSDTVATTDAYSTLATKCYRPKIVDMAGTYASDGAAWGCAACTKPDNCAECTGDKCNVAPSATHGCLKYAKTTGKFAKDSSHACSDDLDGCRMPTPDNKAATWDPCGPCADSSDKTCQACNSGADCNDIAAASVRYCKAGKAADALSTLVSNFCATDSDCTRPFVSYGKAITDASDYGCGDCDAAKKDKTCKNCGTKGNDCNGAWPTNNVKCFKWTWATDKYTISAAAADCNSNDDTAAKCSRPVFVANEAGFKDMDGCGPCPADSKDCKDFGAELNKAGSHECFLWDWNDTDKKWTASKHAAQCDLASDKKCSLPKDRSAKDGFTSSGCGTCKTAEAATCMTTEPGKNWGQRVTISLLAAVLPLLYVML